MLGSGQNGYSVVARLCHEREDILHSWTAKIWRFKELGTIPFCGNCFLNPKRTRV